LLFNRLVLSKNIFIYLTTLIVLVGVSGCGEASKPDIQSKCTINGRGDYSCTYNNKGKAKGSLCAHLKLTDFRVSPANKYIAYDSAIKLMEKSERLGIPPLTNGFSYSDKNSCILDIMLYNNVLFLPHSDIFCQYYLNMFICIN